MTRAEAQKFTSANQVVRSSAPAKPMTRAEAQKYTSSNQVVRSGTAPAKPMTRAEAQKYTSSIRTAKPVNPPARVSAKPMSRIEAQKYTSPMRTVNPVNPPAEKPADQLSPSLKFSISFAEGLSFGSAGFEGAAAYKKFQGRQNAAAVLTNGNAGRLPAPVGSGYKTNADLARSISGKGDFGSRLSFGKEIVRGQTPANWPYSASAQSTNALNAGATQVSRFSWATKGASALKYVDPLVHGISAGFNAKGDIYDQVAAGITGSAKRADNLLFAGSVGFGAATLTTAAGLGTSVMAAPAVGVAAGMYAGAQYEETLVDKGINWLVDNTLGRAEPIVAFVLRTTVNTASSALNWVANKTTNIFGGGSQSSLAPNPRPILSNTLVPAVNSLSAAEFGRFGSLGAGRDANTFGVSGHQDSFFGH